MKILHVVRQFFPSIGGLEDYVMNLSLEQKMMGHEVVVYTLNLNFQTDEELESEDIINGILTVRYKWFGSKRYPIACFPVTQLNQFDIVHVHAVDFFIDYLSLLKRIGRLKTKLVLTTHGGFFHTPNQQGLKRVFFNTISRFSLSVVDTVFTISNNDHKLFEQIKNNCKLIENGVAMEKFGHASPDFNSNDLIYLGRLSSNKKLDWLIDAFCSMKKIKGKLKIIGNRSTGDAAVLEKMVESLSNKGQVELHFNISDEEIIEHIKTSKFVVSSSEYEGFGLSVIEMMSYGLIPLLSSAPESFVGFVEEGSVGKLFSYQQGDFEKSYLSLIDDWSIEKTQQAKLFSRKFSWTEVARNIVNEYP